MGERRCVDGTQGNSDENKRTVYDINERENELLAEFREALLVDVVSAHGSQ